ncbi:hypothetical protein VHEMI08390 [[Torrubiella] hemipterigena]|uniref:Cupin type-2 domain-containing protein n=1 Tax=[Torrubiella] hemipterigena TaxID=1531966 RepID=A0A0A1TDC8_9HYPO|nr:hypothetical protein VHEMI08390 [[Torrubiella] hemipterigena]
MFAPLFFLRGNGPIKSKTADANPVPLQDTAGRPFLLRFFTKDGFFFNEQKWTPIDRSRALEPSSYNPPAHYHINSDEHFYITSGAGTWQLWDRKVYLKKGDHILVPRGKWHRFDEDQTLDEPLAIEVRYDKEQAAMEEAFFRNTLTYISDCLDQNKSPSILQLMIFFIHVEMAPGLRIVPFETLNLWLNMALMYTLGGLGYLVGYKSSYAEYCRPSFKKD